MPDDRGSDEYRTLVEGLVPLDEAQRQSESPRRPFDGLLGAITGSSGTGFHVSFFTGAALLLAAAGLAALLPGSVEGDFWRVGRSTVADVLAVGDDASLPLVFAALALAVLAGASALLDGSLPRAALAAQPFVGGAGVAGIGLLWVGFLAFAILNFVVLLLIVVAYVVATIFVIALFIGMLAGLVTQ